MSETQKPLTKAETINELVERTGLDKSQVTNFLDELGKLISDQLQDGKPGTMNLPGLMKIRVVRKEATPERKGINPFTKEETIFKAKPARNAIKITPLKALKDMV